MKKYFVFLIAFCLLAIFSVFSVLHVYSIITGDQYSAKFIGVSAYSQPYDSNFNYTKYDPNKINENSSTEEKDWLTQYSIKSSTTQERKGWKLSHKSSIAVTSFHDIS